MEIVPVYVCLLVLCKDGFEKFGCVLKFLVLVHADPAATAWNLCDVIQDMSWP